MDDLAQRVGTALLARGLVLATAESCTGGLIAQRATSVAGSSRWFDRGFVTYSNEAKQEMLGVAPALILEHGAVSEAVVRAMASGALDASRATVTVAVSGVAGPGGGTPAKPVGTVCLGWRLSGGGESARRVHLPGDRESIRQQASELALLGVLELVELVGDDESTS